MKVFVFDNQDFTPRSSLRKSSLRAVPTFVAMKTKTVVKKRGAIKRPKIVSKSEIDRFLEQFADDHVWIDKNRERLLEQYAEQWIAVEKGKVIASDLDVHALRKKLANPAFTNQFEFCCDYEAGTASLKKRK